MATRRDTLARTRRQFDLLADYPVEEFGFPPRGGAGGVGGEVPPFGFAQILSAAGTSPPYLYSAQVVTATASGFSAPSGADFDLRNVEESGASGSGVHPLPADSIVMYWLDAASGRYFCNASFYRGTY